MTSETGDPIEEATETVADAMAPVGDALIDTMNKPSVREGARDALNSLKSAASSAKDAASAASKHAKETGLKRWKSRPAPMPDRQWDRQRPPPTPQSVYWFGPARLAKLIADTADTVDSKMGPQYGDYARKAAESVAGTARIWRKRIWRPWPGAGFCAQNPAVAVGAAAVLGFVLMRLARGSNKES